jgi:hypothetical protein
MAVYQQAFNLTSFKGLDPTFFALHLYQIIPALFFKRVQNAKMTLLHSASQIGYTTIQTGNDISRLLRDIYTSAFISNVLGEQFQVMHKLDDSLFVQALDGLNRSAHLLPDYLRSPFTRSIQTFSDRIKKGESIRSSALLVNLSAILQSPTDRASLPPSESHAIAAMLADTVPASVGLLKI